MNVADERPKSRRNSKTEYQHKTGYCKWEDYLSMDLYGRCSIHGMFPPWPCHVYPLIFANLTGTVRGLQVAQSHPSSAETSPSLFVKVGLKHPEV